MRLGRTFVSLTSSIVLVTACAAPAAPSPTAAPAVKAPAAEKPAPAAPQAPAAAPAAANADAEWQKILDAGKKDGKLTIYGRLLSGPEGTIIAEAFKKDTGISVEFVAGAGSPMFSRIKEESKAGRPTADIYEGAQPWPTNIEREGYFLNIKNKPLPVFREPASTWVVDPWYMSKEGNYLGTRYSDIESHVAVHTRVIPPSDFPKSFQELAMDPKYKGKISWVDPKTTQDIGTIWARHGYVGGTLSLDHIWNIYRNQDPQLFPNPVDASAAVGRGEAGLSTSVTGLAGALSAGAPVKVVIFPDTPIVSLISGMGIIKGTPNENAALVFVNWVMGKDGMEVIAKVNQNKVLRREVPPGIPDGLKGEVVGGGNRGPSYVLSAEQAALAGEVEAAGIMRKLMEGISLEDFKAAYMAFEKDWESKRGGPQRQPVVAQP